MKTLFSIYFILLSYCLCYEITAQSLDGTSLAESLKNNVVKISSWTEDGHYYGFGFIVGEKEGKLMIVTADHVVRGVEKDEENKKIEVAFFKKLNSHSAILANEHDKEKDLALIYLDKPKDFQWTKKCLASEESMRRGQYVWFIGRDQKWHVPTSIQAGKISKISSTEPIIEVEMKSVWEGSSGAPLLTSKGIFGMLYENDAARNTIQVLTIEYIQKKILEWEIYDFSALHTTTEKADLGQSKFRRGKSYFADFKSPKFKQSLNIALYKKNTVIEQKIKNTLTQKGFEWELPRKIKPGKEYKLQLSIPGNKSISLYSTDFKIKRKTPFFVKIFPFVIGGAITAIICCKPEPDLPEPPSLPAGN